ncbi:twitch domain-containing radical SAM protein [bacterium]|nr:twitch domain-containing radical SAM protein [bacterium]
MKITFSKPNPPCLAPWIALAVKPNGDVAPDGQYSLTYGNIKTQSLEEILNSDSFRKLRSDFSNNKFGPGCTNCENKEKTLGHSRRIFFEHTLRRFNLELPQNNDSEINIQYLDLNLSNKCNLKCRMCNSISSTSWFVEDRELFKKFGPHLHRPEKPQSSKVEIEHIVRLFQNRNLFKNLSSVALRGGEPLLEIENIKVLEKLVEWDLAKQVTLDISTNGTVVSSEMIKLMSYFKQIDLYVSVDGAGELYKYIRGGDKFSIQDLEKNLLVFREIPQLTPMFTVAVSIYNILKLDELWDWFETIYKVGDEFTFSNAVVRPAYLNFQILPNDLKKRALLKLENSRILEGPHHSGRRLLGDSGKQLIRSSLQQEIFTPEQKIKLIKNFCEFNQELDRWRGTHLLEVVPELAPLFDQVKKEESLPHL